MSYPKLGVLSQPSVNKKKADSHLANQKFGMGFNYGTGVRNKLGRVRDGFGQVEVTPKGLKRPPKSLA